MFSKICSELGCAVLAAHHFPFTLLQVLLPQREPLLQPELPLQLQVPMRELLPQLQVLPLPEPPLLPLRRLFQQADS